MVAMTVSMPIYGKLGDLYGRRRLMLFAIVVFTAASLLCGLAQSMGQLVLARVLQGIGAGGLMAVSQAIIGDIVPPRERPLPGLLQQHVRHRQRRRPGARGLLTEYLSWRWVFWINLPIGLLALAISRRTLVGLPVPRRQPVIDYLGIVLMVVGLTALLLAITQIGQGAAWSDPALLGLFALAALALLLFVAQERRFREPLVPMQLFAVRAATLSWLVAFFASFQAISLTVLVPLRYQSVTGAGADSAALHLLPLVMGLPLGAYCCGRLTASLGRYKPLILLGAVLLPCGIAGLALVPVGDHWLSGLCMLLTGIAIGTQFPTSLVAAQNAVEQRHIGVATSNATLFRSLGGAVGVALMSAILLALLKHLRIGGGLDQGFSESALLSSLDAASGPARVILQHVLADAFKVLFLVNAAVALLGLAVASALPDMTLRGRGATQPTAGE